MDPQKNMKSSIRYFENPVIVELVSSRLADGLEKRLFQTFIRDIPGSAPLTTFESMKRDDIVAAAREGHFGAVKWLHNCLTEVPENGRVEGNFDQICISAASGGHLEIIQWASERGWSPYGFHTSHKLCSSAAAGGHLNVLKWVYNIVIWIGYNPCYEAARFGHLHCLKWFHKIFGIYDEKILHSFSKKMGHLK